MNRLATTLMACALLAIFAFTASTAQEDEPAPDNLIRGDLADVGLYELIVKYSEESGRTVMYSPAHVRQSISIRAPLAGNSHSAYTLLQTTLAQFRLTLISEGDVDIIVPAVEAMRQSTPIHHDEQSLAEAHHMSFGAIVLPVRHAYPSVVQNAIRSVLTGQAGTILHVQGMGQAPGTGSVVVIDYVYNLRKAAEMIREVDRAAAPPEPNPVARVEIKHGDVTAIANAIQATMGPGGLVVAAVQGSRSLVLSGSPALVRNAVQLINELDAAAAPAE